MAISEGQSGDDTFIAVCEALYDWLTDNRVAWENAFRCSNAPPPLICGKIEQLIETLKRILQKYAAIKLKNADKDFDALGHQVEEVQAAIADSLKDAQRQVEVVQLVADVLGALENLKGLTG